MIAKSCIKFVQCRISASSHVEKTDFPYDSCVSLFLYKEFQYTMVLALYFKQTKLNIKEFFLLGLNNLDSVDENVVIDTKAYYMVKASSQSKRKRRPKLHHLALFLFC